MRLGAPRSVGSTGSDEEAVERITYEHEQEFGRYRLAYQIASGGMATVYLGRALGPGGFDRPVAIKRIHPHLARNRKFVEMFLDEARLVSRINHPNVCTVFDFGDVAGTYFIAMEYLVGCSLASLLRTLIKRQEVLDSPRWHALAARIVADACEGLHAAHELREDGEPLGIVHRDVSPQNIFVTYDGAVKVVDFGVALARRRLHQTTTGTLKGKLAYMAPEHARGDALDRRADVWGLGVCLWEMLVGRRLFRRGTEMQTMMAVQQDPVPPPSTLRPGIPAELDAIVLRALSRDADARYPTARALERDLSQFLRRHPEATELADLAEWLTDILPEHRAKTMELVATALRGSKSAVSVPILDDDDASIPSRVDAESEIRPTEATNTRGKRRSSGVGRFALVGLLVVSAAGFAWGTPAAFEMFRAQTASPPSAPREASPPRATSVAKAPAARDAPRGPLSAPRTVASPADTGAANATPKAPTQPTAAESAKAAMPAAPSDETETPLDLFDPGEALPAKRVRRSTKTGTARAPSTPAASSPAEMGAVNIVSVGGWADIYEKGKKLGRTPCRVELPVGSHRLWVYPLGEPSNRTVPVVVTAGEPGRVVIPLN